MFLSEFSYSVFCSPSNLEGILMIVAEFPHQILLFLLPFLFLHFSWVYCIDSGYLH